MIKQLKYFQAVVRCQNFTKAAAECFISQSAISQQIQSLEKELGVQLIHRNHRQISLTPAGEFFYRKSLVLVNDFEKLCAETLKLADGVEQELSIGYLRHSRGTALENAVAEFATKFPEVSLQLFAGTHEEIYEYLRAKKVDMVLSDLRRKPSVQYVNFFLTQKFFYAEMLAANPLTRLEFLTMDDLKNTPIILIAPPHQEHVEEIYFREYFGVKGDFIFVETLEEARLLVTANKGYFPAEFNQAPPQPEAVKFIPLCHKSEQFYRKYFAFWRADTIKKSVEDFAEILKRQFPAETE